MLSQKSETMGIVNQDAEFIFLLQGNYLVKLAEGSCHSIDTFGDQQDTAAVLISLLAGPGEDLVAIDHVVVAVLVLASNVETYSIQKTGMALGVIDDHIMTGREGVDS